MNPKEQLSQKLKWIKDDNLRQTCQKVLDSKKFFTWPASLSFHHNYEGGLAWHTLEVWNIADMIADSRFVQVSNKDIIAASCLWHDFLKTEEYLWVESPIPNQRALQCGDGFFVKGVGEDSGHSHIVNGAKAFVIEARKNGVDESLIEQINHCILSHHGFVKEWGSLVAPKTLESLILHQADMLSAKAGITK